MSEEARAETAKVIDMMVDTTVTPEQAQAVLAGWRGAMAELIATKRAQPGEDITSDLIAARDEDGSRLSEQELTDTIFAILGAGSETTINFFDNAITALLTHPDQLELVDRPARSPGTTSSTRRCGWSRRWRTCRCGTRWRTSSWTV